MKWLWQIVRLLAALQLMALLGLWGWRYLFGDVPMPPPMILWILVAVGSTILTVPELLRMGDWLKKRKRNNSSTGTGTGEDCGEGGNCAPAEEAAMPGLPGLKAQLLGPLKKGDRPPARSPFKKPYRKSK